MELEIEGLGLHVLGHEVEEEEPEELRNVFRVVKLRTDYEFLDSSLSPLTMTTNSHHNFREDERNPRNLGKARETPYMSKDE